MFDVTVYKGVTAPGAHPAPVGAEPDPEAFSFHKVVDKPDTRSTWAGRGVCAFLGGEIERTEESCRACGGCVARGCVLFTVEKLLASIRLCCLILAVSPESAVCVCASPSTPQSG